MQACILPLSRALRNVTNSLKDRFRERELKTSVGGNFTICMSSARPPLRKLHCSTWTFMPLLRWAKRFHRSAQRISKWGELNPQFFNGTWFFTEDNLKIAEVVLYQKLIFYTTSDWELSAIEQWSAFQHLSKYYCSHCCAKWRRFLGVASTGLVAVHKSMIESLHQAYQADENLFFVEHPYQADLLICFVDAKY